MRQSVTLPDGEFLSFDSILKSFFSSSVKNVLSPQSGQHPSTVLTRSPLSFLHSFSLFCLFLLFSPPLWVFLTAKVVPVEVVAWTVVPLSVRPLLESLNQRTHGHCPAAAHEIKQKAGFIYSGDKSRGSCRMKYNIMIWWLSYPALFVFKLFTNAGLMPF